MSDESPEWSRRRADEPDGEWTIRTLHQHLRTLLAETDRRYTQAFEAQKEAVTTALAAAEKAVNSALVAADRAVAKAEIAADKRFESVNEFRKQLSEQTATFPNRTELQALRDVTNSQHDQAMKEINALATIVTTLQSRGSGASDYSARLLTVLGVCAVVAGIIVTIIINR